MFKPFYGSNSLNYDATNTDMNWATVTANTITSHGTIYANDTLDIVAELNNKQNTIDEDTDLTINDLEANNVSVNSAFVSSGSTDTNDLTNTVVNQPLTIFNNSGITSNSLIIYDGDENATINMNRDGTITTENINVENQLTMSNDSLTQLKDTYIYNKSVPLHIYGDSEAGNNNIIQIYDASSNLTNSFNKEGWLGIGGNPEAPLSIYKTLTGKPTNPTVQGIHIGCRFDNALIELCAADVSGSSSTLDFTKANNDFRGRIVYYHSTDVLDFLTGVDASSSTAQMSISNNLIDCKDCEIKTEGTLNIGKSSTHRITLSNDDVNNESLISFSDNSINQGGIRYDVSNNRMDFYTGGDLTESNFKMRLTDLYCFINKQIEAQNGLNVYNGLDVISGDLDVLDGNLNVSDNTTLSGTLQCDGLATFGDNTNNQIIFNTSGANTTNNRLLIRTGYKGATQTNGYCTYDLPNTQTHYFWDNLECAGNFISGGSINNGTNALITGGISCTSIASMGNINTDLDVNCRDVDSSRKINAVDITATGDIIGGSLSCGGGDCTASRFIGGDVAIDTDLIYTNSTTNCVGFDTASPEACVSIVGSGGSNTTFSEQGVHIVGNNGSSNCSITMGSNGKQRINFKPQNGSHTTLHGKIEYDQATDEMSFSANGNSDLLVIGGNNIALNTNTQINADEITFNTDQFYVNSLTQQIGIGTTSPEAALSVCGSADLSTYTTHGVHISAPVGGDAKIELVADTISNNSYIDFAYKSEDIRGRMIYRHNTNTMQIYANNASQLEITDGNIDLKDNTLSNANLNGTKGQLVTFIGENSTYTAWTVNDYVFCYGNGQRDLAGTPPGGFGIGMCGDCKLMKFMYQQASGTTLSTSTKLVFNVEVNGSVVCYAICDFSLTSASVSAGKCAQKFSSSATSQVDVEYAITDPGYGYSIAYRVNGNTANPSNAPDHRMTTIIMTTSDF